MLPASLGTEEKEGTTGMLAHGREAYRGPLDRFVGSAGGTVPYFWVAFAAILIAGGVLRFWNLSGAPIWMDEAVTDGFARLDLATILFDSVDNHPPLTWAIHHIWHAFNPDPAYLRVPSALFGTLTVGAIMLAMRDIACSRAALFTGLLFAFSTGHIYFSQDARMYPYLIFGLVLAAWGGIGHARPRLHGERVYAGLYVIGGAIAIYSHALGLVVMALIGFSSLAAGLMGGEPRRFAREWFIHNIILFITVLPWLVMLPSAAGTFPGLQGDNSLADIQWFFRNMTGFPGLGGPAILFEALLYGAVVLALPIAWLSGRRGLALALAALVFLFPLIILGLHIRQPLMANKILLPGVIGVTIAAGYTLSRLRPRIAGTVLAGLLALAALGSSLVELKFRIKPEDYPSAYAFIDQRGYTDAPVLTCVHFHSAAAWLHRPEARILVYRAGDILHYKGPAYWRAAENSMNWLRAADAHAIDEALGGGWLVEGGLAGALAGEDKVSFIRPACGPGAEAEILLALEALGFVQDGEETLIRGRAADFTILDNPQTRVSLFQR